MANPEIGAFRDWDVLSFPALSLSLWAACALLRLEIARYEAVSAEGVLSKHGLPMDGRRLPLIVAVEADPRNMRFREGVAREELALGLSDAASATLLAVLELHD